MKLWILYLIAFSIIISLLTVSYFILYKPITKYSNEINKLHEKAHSKITTIEECHRLKSEIISLYNSIDSLYNGLRNELYNLYYYIDGIERGLKVKENER